MENKMSELSKEQQDVLKEGLDSKIEKVFNQYSIDSNEPIDIFGLLEKIGFSVFYSDLKQYDGLIVVDETREKFDNFESNKIIAVNSNLGYEKSVFTLAHELAHFLCLKWLKCDENIQLEYRENSMVGKRTESENFIDFVAASILLPKKSFVATLNNFGVYKKDEASDEMVKRLASFYELEVELIKRRIGEVLD